MQHLEEQYGWLSSPQAYISLKHNENKLVAFERGNLLWIFNFHPTQSFADYKIGTEWAGKYSIALNTDRKIFGGHDRIDESISYHSQPHEWDGKKELYSGIYSV
ncbi:unnamed protein product [Rhizophagus irregularis]|nr:unnamed protein product [Rhizophagus irregularis]